MIKWENNVQEIYACGNEALKERLNHYGKDGWEVTTVDYQGDDMHKVIMRRPKTVDGGND